MVLRKYQSYHNINTHTHAPTYILLWPFLNNEKQRNFPLSYPYENLYPGITTFFLYPQLPKSVFSVISFFDQKIGAHFGLTI